MHNTEHRDEWAWEQVEAAADGSLSAEERRRFDAAVARDPELWAATERARDLQESLRGLRPVEIPHGLLGRLWSIPAPARKEKIRSSSRSGSGPWLLVAAPVAALSVAALTVLLFIGQQPPEPDPREVAVQEFLIAMNYLQQGAEIASNEVQGQVQNGILDALIVSRESLLERDTDSENGG